VRSQEVWVAKDDPEIRFRAPEGVKRWLKDKARASRRSASMEVVHLLEAAMAAEAGRPSGGAPAAGNTLQG
jgi:hypothetical protein